MSTPWRRSIVTTCITLLVLNAYGIASALTVEIIEPATDPAVVILDEPTDFEAVAYDAMQEDISGEVSWTWDFGDTGTSDENPTQHTYTDAGDFMVTATASYGGQQAQAHIICRACALVYGTDVLLARQLPNLSMETVSSPVCHMRYILLLDDDAEYTNAQIQWKDGSGRGWMDLMEFDGTGFGSQPTGLTLDGNYHSRVFVHLWPTSECANDYPEAGWKNEAVDWRIIAEYYEPGDMDPKYDALAATWEVENTVLSSGPEVIKLDPAGIDAPDNVDITWTTDHVDKYGVHFNVDIEIADISGNVIYEHTETNVALGAGSWTWDGTRYPEEPGGSTTAEKGIYTYSLLANCRCDTDHSCSRGDWDKSGFLEVSMDRFLYVWKDTQNGQLKVVTRYSLNRDAAKDGVALKFYGPALTELGSKSGQACTAGTNWSDVILLSGVTFDANGNPEGPIYAVVYAMESDIDANENRDRGDAKPALQKGMMDPVQAAVGLQQVSFSSVGIPGNYYTVTKYGGLAYTAPHWLDNSSPLDGDAEDVGDRKYPVCYRWGTTPGASCVIQAHPSWGTLTQGQVYVYGDGEGNLDFPPVQATVSGNTVTYPATASTSAFPSEVWHHPYFHIAWFISTNGGTSYNFAGVSSDEVFVFRPGTLPGGPGCNPLYRTVLRLGCENGGGSDPNDIFAATWGGFADLDVDMWSDVSQEYDLQLWYWQDAGNEDHSTVDDLLGGQDANCAAWADLLLEACRVNNLPGLSRTQVVPPNGGNPPHEFCVDVAATRNPPCQYPTDPDGYTWDVLTQLDIWFPGAFAQGAGNHTPQLKTFGNHYIVRRRTGGSFLQPQYTWYDPSYGRVYSDEADMTSKVVFCWIKNDAGTLKFMPRTDAPSLVVVFR